VLAVCTLLRALARQAQRRTDNLAVALVACCLRCVLDLVEFLNKFAVCMHAITGDDLCAAGRGVTETLSRHGLSAWFVDRISSFVLGMTTAAFAFVAGVVTYVLLSPRRSADAQAASDARTVATVFATLAALLAFLILNFCAAFINNVVDAAYTCFALDLDAGAPHQPPLRDVMLPICKPDYVVVAQPADNATPTAVAVPIAMTSVVQAQPLPPPGFSSGLRAALESESVDAAKPPVA